MIKPPFNYSLRFVAITLVTSITLLLIAFALIPKKGALDVESTRVRTSVRTALDKARLGYSNGCSFLIRGFDYEELTIIDFSLEMNKDIERWKSDFEKALIHEEPLDFFVEYSERPSSVSGFQRMEVRVYFLASKTKAEGQ